MPDLNLAIRVRADLQRAVRDLDRLEKELRDTGRAGRQAEAGATRAARGYERARAAAARTGRALISIRGALAGVGAVLVAREILDAGLAIERLEQRFRAAAGGARAAEAELAFVREEADRLGINFRDAADAYSGFLAAARGTTIQGRQAREVFIAVAEASRVMGLTSEQASGAMLALEQIMSKGKVSAEELRGQLGERLPGAFQIAARAMGVTTAELDEMLVKGELLADEFLPRFARELRATVADELPNAIESQASAFERLGNAIDRLAEKAANSGLTRFFADLAESLASLADAASAPAPSLADRQTEAQRILAEREAALAEAEAQLENRRGTPRQRRALERRIQNLRESVQEAADRRDTETVESLTAQIRRIVASPLDPRSQRSATDRLQRDIGILRAQSERQFGILGDLGADFSAGPEPQAQATRQEKAARDTAAKIVAIRERAEDRLARLTLDRIEQVDHAEQRQLERLERDVARQIAKAGDNEDQRFRIETNAEVARTAIVRAAVAERAAIRAEEYDKEAEARAEAIEKAAEAEEEYLDRVLAANEEAAENARKAWERSRSGIERGLASYVMTALDTNSQIEQATVGALRGMEDAMVQFVQTGKLSFSDLANSIIADLARIAARQALGGIFGSLLGGGFGGGSFSFGSGPAPFHGGGVAGYGTRTRTGVDPRLFVGARRFHGGGIAGDEIPAILRRGETVRTPEQEAALGRAAMPESVRVEIDNRGTPQRATEADFSFDGRAWVIGIAVEDLATGGDLARAIEGIVPGTTL